MVAQKERLHNQIRQMTLKMQATREKARAGLSFKAKTDNSINCKYIFTHSE